MKLAFSTLGCPEWDLDRIITAAREWGYDGVEWRGYQDEMELPRAPIFTAAARNETRRRFQDSALEFVCLGSSVRLSDPASERRERERSAFAAYAELARFLGCGLVRVFGGNLPSGVEREAALPEMAGFLRELGEIAADQGVTVALETHDAFSTGAQVAELLRRADHPSVGALWDLHHPYRQGGGARAGHGPALGGRGPAGNGDARGEPPQGAAVLGRGVVDDEQIGEAAVRASREAAPVEHGRRPAAVQGDRVPAAQRAHQARELPQVDRPRHCHQHQAIVERHAERGSGAAAEQAAVPEPLVVWDDQYPTLGHEPRPAADHRLVAAPVQQRPE